MRLSSVQVVCTSLLLSNNKITKQNHKQNKIPKKLGRLHGQHDQRVCSDAFFIFSKVELYIYTKTFCAVIAKVVRDAMDTV